MVKDLDREQPAAPPGSAGTWLQWLVDEAMDHLLPWSGKFFQRPFAMQAASIGLAVVVTAAWVLAAAGRVASVVALAWWIGWSVYEIIVRKHCKPWVKDGPWWGSSRRPAGTMDLISYVATKNLLIGALLFLLLTALGVLRPLG